METVTTGLDTARMIPVGATVAEVTWHVAGHYGPSRPYPSELHALAAGIALGEQNVERYRNAHGDVAARFPAPETLSIDLRWKMTWTPGALDAHNRPTVSSGQTFTVTRTTYATLAEAREHLARLTKYEHVRSAR